MKPEPQEAEKNLSEDLKTLEKLPAMTRKLLLLGDQAEKASGENRANFDTQIRLLSGLAKH